jgi:hypothetical protein
MSPLEHAHSLAEHALATLVARGWEDTATRAAMLAWQRDRQDRGALPITSPDGTYNQESARALAADLEKFRMERTRVPGPYYLPAPAYVPPPDATGDLTSGGATFGGHGGGHGGGRAASSGRVGGHAGGMHGGGGGGHGGGGGGHGGHGGRGRGGYPPFFVGGGGWLGGWAYPALPSLEELSIDPATSEAFGEEAKAASPASAALAVSSASPPPPASPASPASTYAQRHALGKVTAEEALVLGLAGYGLYSFARKFWEHGEAARAAREEDLAAMNLVRLNRETFRQRFNQHLSHARSSLGARRNFR